MTTQDYCALQGAIQCLNQADQHLSRLKEPPRVVTIKDVRATIDLLSEILLLEIDVVSGRLAWSA